MTEEYDLLPIDEDEFPLLPAEEEETVAEEEAPLTVESFDPLIAGVDVARETVVLELHIRQPGRFKAMDSDKLVEGGILRHADGTEEVVDPKLLRVSKEIIDRKELKEINKKLHKFKNYIKKNCARCSMLSGAKYLLPLLKVKEVDTEIAKCQKTLNEQLDALALVYEDIKDRARARLGPIYDEGDYPEFNVWREAWKVDSQLWAFNVPAALSSIDRQLLEREKSKIAMRWADTAEEIREGLRVGFGQLIARLLERLGSTEDGKPKTFKASTVEQLQTFLSTFSSSNLTNDKELEDLVRQARQLIDGVDPKAIRKEDTLRETLEKGFVEIAEAASKLTVAKERKFAFASSELIPEDESEDE